MAVGVSVSVSKVAAYSRMTEVNSFYARVVADGGTISDFSALRLAVLDYKAVQSLEPSLYTFASGRKAGVQYSLVPTDGSGDLSVTRSGDTAMELNANGFWQPAAANVPRYDYASGRPMINVEELRTNLLTRYKSFAHSDWTKSGAGIEGDPTTAGADILAGWDFTNWIFSTGSATQNSFTNLSAIRKTGLLTVGKLYYIRVVGTTNDLNLILYDGYVGATKIADLGSGSFNFSGYFYAHSTSSDPTALQFDPSSTTSVTTITTLELQEVTGYASPFVDANGANLMDGYKLVEGTNNGLHYITIDQTGVIGETFSYTFYAKAAERSKIQLTFQSAGLSDTIFDLAAVTATKGSLVTKAEISHFKDGWYKCTITSTLTVTSRIFRLYTRTTTDSYQGDGTSGVLIAHAQLEAGATASSPIGGAEGSAQSRNADVIVKTGASAIIGQTEGYAVVEVNISKFYSAGRYLLALYNNLSSVANSIRLYLPSNRIDLSVFNSSGVESNLSIKTITSTGIYKIGIAWKDNDCVLVVNSEVITATKSGALGVGNLSNIIIGANRVITELFNDQIKLVHLGKTRISNEKLIELTTL